MTTLEKLGYTNGETAEEVAVDMLIEHIWDDVDGKIFKTNCVHGVYPELYKSLKEWLESEAEE